MAKRILRQPAFMSRLAVFVLITSSLCFSLQGGKGKSGQGGKGVSPGTKPEFTGLDLRVLDSTIPPGGLFQFQLKLTEPKPIGHGSTRPNVPAGRLRGISLNDPIGQTAGVAIVNGSGILVNFTSPQATFGADLELESPILTVATTIPTNATRGQTFPLSINPATSFWFKPNGQPYPQEI